MRLLAALFGVVFSLASLSRASAEESPVRGLRIVVPDAHGKAAYGKAALTKALRRTMTEAVGPLIPSRDLSAAQKKLKLKGKKARTVEGYQQAAQKTKAQYVLAVDITKEKWLYTARALLINVETGQVQMDFRSQYFRPDSEAGDRGKRIGLRTIQKLEQLQQEGSTPFSGTGAVATRTPKEEPVDDKLPAGDGELNTEKPEKKPPPIVAKEEPKPEPKLEPKLEPKVEPKEEPIAAVTPPASSSGSGTSAKIEIQPTRIEEEGPELLRFGLNAGAGLLHTYDLSSSAVDHSGLSYRLDPLALVAGSFEFVLPGLPIGLQTRAAFRPVRFNVAVVNATPGMTADGTPAMPNPKANQPAGRFLDFGALLDAHITVAGYGRQAWKLIPGLGFKFGILTVDPQPGNVIVSSNEIAAIAAFGFRMPLNDTLELDVGIDGGRILTYKESPADSSGASNGGYTLGGDFQARIWLSSAIGIAFDTRFDYDKVSFSGVPARSQVTGEMLQDVSTITKDLRTGVGIAFRL